MNDKTIKKLVAVKVIFIIIFIISVLAIFIKPSYSAIISAVSSGLMIGISGQNREKTIYMIFFIYAIFYLQQWIVNFNDLFSVVYLANALIYIVNVILLLIYKKGKIIKLANHKRIVIFINYLIVLLLAISIYMVYQNLHPLLPDDRRIILAIEAAAVLAAFISLFVSLIYAYVMLLSYDQQCYDAFFKKNPIVAIREVKK